jgi:epoxyqueuosine reductase
MIDALRCLTYVNEHEGPWPEWLSAGAHHCLVGCMRCQEVCPANEHYSRREELVAEFDPEETAIILRDLPAEELPAVLWTKLGLLDLEGYSTVLGRNLRALTGWGSFRRDARR